MFFDLRLTYHAALAVVLTATAAAAISVPVITRDGMEHSALFNLKGAQINPHVSLSPFGGYLIAEDNTIDGKGQGIRARQLFADLSGSRGSHVVNTTIVGDQKDGKVAVSSSGSSVFAWLTPSPAGHQTKLRFMSATGIFHGPEISASLVEGFAHSKPEIAILADGSLVVVWASMEQDGHFQGVFAQRFTHTGDRIGKEFQVNQTTPFNQRAPAITALHNGGFVIAWVGEQQRNQNSFDIYARLYSASGAPVSGEFRLNSTDNVCANPVLASLGQHGFTAGWSERKFHSGENGWDIVVRTFDQAGQGQTQEQKANQKSKGDQYVPQIATLKGKVFIVWTSLGQDGYDEGVFARLMDVSGVFETDEFQVNTTTVSRQRQPAVSSNGQDSFMVVWSSFAGLQNSFEIVAQRYRLNQVATLPVPAAPFASALSQASIAVTWPDYLGENVQQYEIYIDGSSSPITTQDIFVVVENPSWPAGSSHTVRIAYLLRDGRKSPLSESITVKTWGLDNNNDGLPDDWQNLYWGVPGNWSWAQSDPDEDGATNLQEFFAGTNPIDNESVLVTALQQREQGLYLTWNTQAGGVYQVQASTNLSNWTNHGSSRFATSSNDSVPVGDPGTYYRVIRLR